VGPATALTPKKLAYISVVKVAHNGSTLGERRGALQLGREGERRIKLLTDPEEGRGQRIIMEQLWALPNNEGLEFVYDWDGNTAALLVLSPVGLSLLFISGWLIYQRKVGGLDTNADIQIALQTAVVVAGYIVTASAVVIALITFLDAHSQRVVQLYQSNQMDVVQAP